MRELPDPGGAGPGPLFPGPPPHRVVLVTGIGQAAKIVHYLNVNGFNGLHGRTIAAAAGLKLARPDLTVIAESGDGDLYGEGGTTSSTTSAATWTSP